MNQRRIILHIDMNSFYASVEASQNANLRGKPLAIAGNPQERRGIVLTSSYEAREKGVYTTMPLWEAKKRCPDLIVMPPNFPLYRDVSKKMFEILHTYSEIVEPVSIDEGYIDLTNCVNHPIEIAQDIQKSLRTKLNLPCSIGIAPNKFLAKMASNMKKPLGITILRKRDVEKVLWPMPVEEMHGIGHKTAEKLNAIGINSIADLAEGDPVQLKIVLGVNGIKLKEKANGNDFAPVDPLAATERKSVGNSTTLPTDLDNEEELLHVMEKLAQKVSERLRNQDLYGYSVQITLRYSNRETITRNKKMDTPIVTTNEIYQLARMLLKRHWTKKPIRLLGVAVHDIEKRNSSTLQLNLFSYKEEVKDVELNKVVDSLSQKYGQHIIQKGFYKPGKEDKR